MTPISPKRVLNMTVLTMFILCHNVTWLFTFQLITYALSGCRLFPAKHFESSGLIMRPDEHKKKKNELYKRKHGAKVNERTNKVNDRCKQFVETKEDLRSQVADLFKS